MAIAETATEWVSMRRRILLCSSKTVRASAYAEYIEMTTDERLDHWYSFKHALIGQLQERFRASGRNYDDMARALGWTPQQVERRITAQCRVKTRWMNDLACELGCRVRPSLEQLRS